MTSPSPKKNPTAIEVKMFDDPMPNFQMGRCVVYELPISIQALFPIDNRSCHIFFLGKMSSNLNCKERLLGQILNK